MAEETVKAADITGGDATEVEFEHPDTGERYGGTFRAFRLKYQPRGFVLTNRADDALLFEADAKAAAEEEEEAQRLAEQAAAEEEEEAQLAEEEEE